jgi:hypothetical protein
VTGRLLSARTEDRGQDRDSNERGREHDEGVEPADVHAEVFGLDGATPGCLDQPLLADEAAE